MPEGHLLRFEMPGEDGYDLPEMSIPLAVLPAGLDPDAACRSLEAIAKALARHHGRRRAWTTRWHRDHPEPPRGESAHARAALQAWQDAYYVADGQASWEEVLGRAPILAERLLVDAIEMRPRPLRAVAEPLPLLAPAPFLDLPPAEEIRAWISPVSETTPETVYLTSPAIENMAPKVLADGAALGPLQIAAMTLASSCATHGLATADLRIQVVRCPPALRTGRFDVRGRRMPFDG